MWRLVPNTSVLTTTTNANAAPRIAERTGTVLRPRPGSSANRTPVANGAGSADAAATRAAPDCRGVADTVRRATRCGASRAAIATAIAASAITNTSAPNPSTVQSNAIPRDGYTAAHRSDRCERRQRYGDDGCEQGADDDRAAHSDEAVARRHRRTGPQRADRVELVGVDAELPADNLARDQQRRQCGDEAEHP